MDLRTVFLGLALLFLAMPALAREHTDVIVMKNGDRMTGEVKAIDAGVLYIDLDYVDGTISIEWSKVAYLESNQPFILKTLEGSVYSGTLKTLDTPLDQPMKLQITDKAHPTGVALDGSRIATVDQTSEKFWQRLNGAVSFGTTYTKGNQSTQYNLSSQTEYLRERWRAQVDFSSNLTSSSGVDTSARNQFGLSALHLLPWKNYFYGGLGRFLQSSEQGIRLQSNFGGGIGRYLKNTNRTSLSILTGLAWQSTRYEHSTDSLGRQNVAAGLVSTELKAFAFKKTNLKVTANLFPSVSEPGRLFANTNATYYLKIFGDLSWNLSFYGDWDNNPPNRLSGSDYGTSAGLSWTFGNR